MCSILVSFSFLPKICLLTATVGDELKSIHATTKDTKAGVEALHSDNRHLLVEKWLDAPDSSTNLNRARETRHGGTGIWWLENELFQEWHNGTRRTLWLHGIPGCGKTVLSATTIDYLNQQLTSSGAVLEFFFDFTDAEKQTLDKLLRSLIVQLYTRYDVADKEIHKAFASHENGRRQPTSETLSATLIAMLSHIEEVEIVIDALDECSGRKDLLRWVETLTQASHATTRLLMTSRREEDIESELSGWMRQEDIIPILSESVDQDIRAYVHERIRSDHAFRRWHSNQAVQEEIETELMEKSGGM
jgi:hypothetical protein